MSEPHHDADLCRRLAANIMELDVILTCKRCWGSKEYELELCRGEEDPNHELKWSLISKSLMHKGNTLRPIRDYCCNPKAMWMLQQKIVVEKGYNFDLAWHDGEATAIFWGEHPSEHIGRDSHPLKATALAADDIKERTELRSARGH